MILAELEVYHSRPVAPTRRVALGRLNLPVDPPPGFGGILLGGVVANHIAAIDPDLVPDLIKLTMQLENGLRVPQPRLRHRFQLDKVGLQPSRHRLVGAGDSLVFEFDDARADPAQQVLGAVYAAGQLPLRVRPAVMGTVRRGIGWQGPVGPELISALAGFDKGASWSHQAMAHPVEWAMEVLGLTGRPTNGARRINGANGANGSNGANSDREYRAALAPSRSDIQRAYRRALIDAHPDHGARADGAAQRIADLGEARRILLG